MKNIKIFFSILFLLSIMNFLVAEEVMEKKQKTQTKREITADSLKWEYEKGTALFTGNVAMKGEEGDISCEKMIVFFDEEDEIEKMIGEGSADLIREKQKGSGEIIEIFPSQDLLILKNNAWISSEKAVFNGEEIHFDTAKEIINITKGVKGEIQTGSEEKPTNGGTEAQSSKGTKEGENN